MPEFISVGYVDSHAITTYDSITRKKEPRAPWMAENLAPDHWERYTQLLRSWQQTFTVELKHLQRHYNHSGVIAADEHSPSLNPSQKAPAADGQGDQLLLSSVVFGKTQKIGWMGFSAHHLPCGSSTMSFIPCPHIPSPLASNKFLFSHSKFAHLGFHFSDGWASRFACFCTETYYMNCPRDISGSCISLAPTLHSE